MSHKRPIDPIQPADIPLTRPQPDADTRQDQVERKQPVQKLVIGVSLAAALLLALAVVFVLPRMISPPDISEQTAEQQLEEQPAATAKPLESPWSQAQLAKARRDAQDILAKLLEMQQHLEDKAVRLWADERYQQGLDSASNGDMAFRKREFDDALAGYQQALDIFTELEQQVEKTLAGALEQGLRAIDSGDAIAAREQFELALAIEPGNSAAESGLARSEVLDQVLAELEKADLARQGNQLETARDHIQAALKLDSQHRRARQGLQTIDEQILQRDYIEALSQGYSRLEQGQLKNARSAFNKALQLRPGSDEARRALEQTGNRLSRQSMQSQLAVAVQREQEENWQAAEALYNQILSSDSSVVEARSGQIRSSVRAQLDEKLQELIDHSMRLTSSNVYRDAQQLLKEARAIQDRGPKINKQITTLQTALIKASTRWPVELQSDNATNVTLFRVGNLGQFSHKTLKLKPGRYVATGSRKGYRDVRVEFTITGANQTGGPVIIKCKDII